MSEKRIAVFLFKFIIYLMCRNVIVLPEGVLRISSDGDDQRIFLGLKFLIPRFFWVGKFGKYFFWWLDLSRDFLGVFKTI